jgi:hypothetical protein
VVQIRDTNFQLQATLDISSPSIQDIFEEMVIDEARNDLIFDDVLRALEAGRSPVVITERTAHLETIAKRLERFARHVIVLRGGQSEKQRRDIAARLAAIPQAEECVIVATGRYLGEGFDDRYPFSYHADCMERYACALCWPIASPQRRQARGDHI